MAMAENASDSAELIRLYRQMLLIRRCEEQLAKSHQRGLVHGACHTYVGQEAVAVGVCAHLRGDDVVFSTHRGHGHALAKGVPPVQLIAELYGRANGCSRGRGGSMHLFAPEVGLMGTSGIVGPCILQAAGAGYSFRLLKKDNVAVAFFGDGAANNAAFHEGLNLASIWKLPVLFVCENNQFATEVPFAYAAGNPSVASRGASYGIPGVELDGNDVLAISAAAEGAVARARAGGGPTLFECKTYRTRPHAEGMGDYTYRTREDVEGWKAKCPIDRLRATLAAGGVAEAELDAIDAEIRQEVEKSHQAAEAAPWPDPITATTHVYAEPRRVPEPPPPGERVVTYSQATLEALGAEMTANPRIFVLGEGIGARGGNFRTTAGLYDKFGPERLRDTPITERGFVGLACGAAMTGTRPAVDFMFADFVLDGVGEIVNQIAKMQYMSSGRLKMPVLLRGCVGIGHSAATHHSGNYYPLFAQFPGLRVAVPSTPYDAKGLLHHALRCDDPGDLPRTPRVARDEGLGAGGRLRNPIREGGGGAGGAGRHHRRAHEHGPEGAQGGRGTGRRGRIGRSDRPAHGRPAGCRGYRQFRREDRSVADRGRGVRPLRHRRGDRRAGRGALLRRTRRAHQAAERPPHADAVQPAAGGRRRARRRGADGRHSRAPC
jgi:2-oxoisovalerate dehydrogenase E1 component